MPASVKCLSLTCSDNQAHPPASTVDRNRSVSQTILAARSSLLCLSDVDLVMNRTVLVLSTVAKAKGCFGRVATPVAAITLINPSAFSENKIKYPLLLLEHRVAHAPDQLELLLDLHLVPWFLFGCRP